MIGSRRVATALSRCARTSAISRWSAPRFRFSTIPPSRSMAWKRPQAFSHRALVRVSKPPAPEAVGEMAEHRGAGHLLPHQEVAAPDRDEAAAQAWQRKIGGIHFKAQSKQGQGGKVEATMTVLGSTAITSDLAIVV